jgi:flagellar hook-associated protein 1 FlgK
MTGLLDSIQNAVSGLTANRAGTRQVSQNLANASVDGYHARRAELASLESGRAGAVAFRGVERAKAAALTQQARQAAGENAGLQARLDVLRPIGERIGDPKDGSSLGGRLARFDAKLRELASDPSDPTRLQAAAEAARDAAGRIRGLAQQVQDQRARAETLIQREVGAVNDALNRIHTLNAEIARAEQTEQSAATLKDARARAIDRVAEAMEIRVEPGEHGRVDLYTQSGVTLLDEEAGPNELEFTKAAAITATDVYDGAGAAPPGKDADLSGLKIGDTDVTPSGDGAQRLDGGRLAGLFQARDGDLIDLQNDLDALARDLIQTFQDPDVDPSTTKDVDGDSNKELAMPGLFVDGRNDKPYNGPVLPPKKAPSSSAGYELHDDTPTQTAAHDAGLAGHIRINDSLSTDDLTPLRDGVNVAKNPDVSEKPPGDSSQIDRFAEALTDADRSRTRTGTPTSLIGKAESLVGTFQTARSELQADADAAEAAAETARTARQDAVAVNQDQQMQRLLELQKAYQANARAVSTAQSMFDSLLRATG